MLNVTRLSLVAFALVLATGTASAQSTAPAADTVKRAGQDITVPLPAADRDKYVGSYTLAVPSGEIMTVKIWVEGDQLLAQADEQPRNVLRYLGGESFHVDNLEQDTRVTFKIENGHATIGTVLQGDATMIMTRVK